MIAENLQMGNVPYELRASEVKMQPRDSNEASLLWLREELAKLGVQSYIIPASDTQGPSLHCGWGERMVTVTMCYGNYLFLGPSRQWVKIPGNRPQECASEITGEGENNVLGK